ncbi:D-alanyl-D-alanine carboxypeptidase [Candidatus Kaiserbacteria bacterium]|nr:D-alanyl-D-alanine carboxypeptidase [Candidatus Kaiserbacteria bacterium]
MNADYSNNEPDRPDSISNGVEPTQPETINSSAIPQTQASASLGRAIIIIAVAIVIIVAFAAFSPAPERDVQSATAAVAFDAFKGISLEAKSAIVIDMRSGKTLFEKNAETQLPLASLTKVALALVVAEALPLDSVITIPYYAGGAGSGAHLLKGERWSVADVIDFTLVESSNNGAGILADAANERIRKLYPESDQSLPHGATLSRMNELSRTLVLTQTYFLNVSGLDLSTTQAGAYGSARDMAKLFAYAASAQSGLFAGTARDGILLTTSNGGQTAASNTNEAQGAIAGLIMGKTGLTDLAGGNLAVVFDVGLSHPVVAVVLGSSESGRFSDIQKLVEATQTSLSTAE